MRMTMEAFEALPEDVQKQVRSHLRAFNECNVVFEYGRFEVGGGTCIKAVYGPDHKFHGVVHADDIYTPEERICNYIEAFHDYPPQYKGKRDYKMLKWLTQMRRDGHEIPIRLVEDDAMPPVLGRVCGRCGSPVWVSALRDTENEYVYQCFECDEDLYTIETCVKLTVDGTKEDTGFMGPGFCDEFCPQCENETYNIPTDRVSLCAHCGENLYPCAACEMDCAINRDTTACKRFPDVANWIAEQKASQEPIQPQG